MSSNVDWQTEGPAVATVRQGGPIAARLFGIPFLLAGGYLGYQFVGGMLSPGELTWAGWTLLPLMAMAFLVPGWILTAARRTTRLDAAKRVVVEELDYRVYARRTSSEVSRDSVVMLRYESSSASSNSNSNPIYTINVYLETPGKKLVLLALFSDGQKSEALAFATKAAAFLSITTSDRLVEGGEVTSGGVVVAALDPDEAG